MNGQPNEIDSGRLEGVAARAFRLLSEGNGIQSDGALESGGIRTGPPDQGDAERITAGLARSLPPEGSDALGRDPQQEARLVGNALLQRAKTVLARMQNDGPRTPLTITDAVALESVLMVRGRPSLRVQATGIEAIDAVHHPGSGMWNTLLNTCEQKLVRTSASVGAVMVQFTFSNLPPQVVGTAWMVGDGMHAITNRHVLFPPGGSALARRNARLGAGAKMRSHIRVWVDFAHNGPGQGPIRREVMGVAAVTPDSDPIDAAIIRLEAAGPPALRLDASRQGSEEADLIYVIGHPGKMIRVPENVASVFGNPDGEKRVSFGETMPQDPSTPHDVVHDSSTIGGFSGGLLGNPLAEEDLVLGLHYLGGSPTSGNRALCAHHLKSHPLLAALLQP